MDFLHRLHAAEIRYCHWTGSESMRAVLAGEKDFDLLVDRRAAQVLGRILCETGFKRFDAAPGRVEPGIEDYLAMDPATGKLIHLHLHYQLTVGGPALKAYQLPWVEVALSTRVLEQEWGGYALEPHLALILLATRAALQLRAREFLPAALGGIGLPAATARKFGWLSDRVVPERLLETGRDLIGEGAARMLVEQAGRPPSARWLRTFRTRIVPRLAEYRIYHGVEERWQRWRQTVRILWGRVRHQLFPGIAPKRRRSPRGGIIVALIGADGSGKSTLVRELTRWLSWKADVLPLYLGSGSGRASLLRRPLRVYRVLRSRGLAANGSWQVEAKLAGAPTPVGPAARQPALRFRWARQVWYGLWAWTIYREKRSRLGQARRARGQGRIVICDRYPQSQVMGFNDGPLLSTWLEQRHWIPRALARRESAVYRAATHCPPDLVIKLVAPTEVAWRRKPERSMEALERRVEAVRALRFPPHTRVVEIDAAQPLDRVLLEAKASVWENL